MHQYAKRSASLHDKPNTGVMVVVVVIVQIVAVKCLGVVVAKYGAKVVVLIGEHVHVHK